MGSIEERKTTMLIGSRTADLKAHEAVQSIGFLLETFGNRVVIRGMLLNGKIYGSGSRATEILHLAEDEHINFVQGDSNNMDLRTNLGRSIIHQGQASEPKVLENVEVLGISPGNVDGSSFVFSALTVSNATTEGEPSIEEEGVFALIDIVPQFSKITTAQSTETRRLSAASKIVAKQFGTAASVTAKAKVKVGALFAKSSFSASISASSTRSFTDIAQISEQVAEKESSGTTTVTEVPEGYVGLQLVKVSLVREADGFEWLYPTVAPEFLILKSDDALTNQAFYDMTGVVEAQLLNLDAERLDPDKPFNWYDLPGAPSTRSKSVFEKDSILEVAAQDQSFMIIGGILGGLLVALVMVVLGKGQKRYK